MHPKFRAGLSKPNRTAGVKSQSAMEYLMTYGWSILVIAVVIAALFSLGVFNGSGHAVGPGSCVAISGWQCTKATLSSSGTLSVSFGEIGQVITVTGIGCTLNLTAPSSMVNVNISLSSGQVSTVPTSCPITPNSPIGTQFNGYLWIQYNVKNGAQGVSQLFGKIKTTVQSGGGFQTPGSGVPYVPINVINYNSTAGTGANFQQMINLTATSYTSYEASDLGNIRFYQGPTELHSWCESGCSATSSKAILWVLIPGGLASGASMPANKIQINMTFTNTTYDYDGVYAGEAPQLTSTYAKYDNGATVFSVFYDNFVNLNKWSVTYSNNAVLGTGLSMGTGLLSLSSTTSPVQIGYFGEIGSNIAGVNTGGPITILATGNGQFGGSIYEEYSSLQWYANYNYNGNQLLVTTATPLIGTAHVFSVGMTNSIDVAAMQDYGSYINANTPGGSGTFSPPYNLFVFVPGPVPSVTTYWMRVRHMPPGITGMPAVSFGSVTH